MVNRLPGDRGQSPPARSVRQTGRPMSVSRRRGFLSSGVCESSPWPRPRSPRPLAAHRSPCSVAVTATATGHGGEAQPSRNEQPGERPVILEQRLGLGGGAAVPAAPSGVTHPRPRAGRDAIRRGGPGGGTRQRLPRLPKTAEASAHECPPAPIRSLPRTVPPDPPPPTGRPTFQGAVHHAKTSCLGGSAKDHLLARQGIDQRDFRRPLGHGHVWPQIPQRRAAQGVPSVWVCPGRPSLALANRSAAGASV